MQRARLDQAGTATSVACAIHCAVSPFLLPLLPLMGRRVVGPTLEVAFALLALGLGVISLGHSYRAVHRDPRTLLFFFTGFTTLMLVHWFNPRPAIEAVGIGAAASLIVGSHVLNLRLCHSRRGHGQHSCGSHQGQKARQPTGASLAGQAGTRMPIRHHDVAVR
jgi:hypothetical protein